MNAEARRQKPEVLAFVAIGSNLGRSREAVMAAITHAKFCSDFPILQSSLWETEPVNCSPGSPNFVNAVVGFIPKIGETPESLLKKMQELEKVFGRRPKKIPNAPRPLDLDLIAFGREVRRTAELTLPHPRAHLRRFVLQPLSEIAPGFVLPGQSSTVQELLDQSGSDETLTRIV